MADPNIETFRGTAPRCRYCNKPLRPNYKSEHEKTWDTPRDQREYRKAWITDPEQLRLRGLADGDGHLIDPPTEDEEADDYFGTRERGGFDARKGMYFKYEVVRRVLSRKFEGTFGARGDNLFCKTECGYQFAVRAVRGGRTTR